MKVEVLEFDPKWIERFNSEKLLITECLGKLVVKIHHIGSTSVSGLAAKPIIDIIIEVGSLSTLDSYKSEIELIGYEAMGEFGISGRRYYLKGGSNKSHQMHAFKSGDVNVKRHIAFRDYLKTHPVVAREYEKLKIQLARTCNNDIEQYCDGKDEFIKYYESKAIRWLTTHNKVN